MLTTSRQQCIGTPQGSQRSRSRKDRQTQSTPRPRPGGARSSVTPETNGAVPAAKHHAAEDPYTLGTLWLFAVLIAGLAPLMTAYFALPKDVDGSEVLKRGDAFVFVATLLCGTSLDLYTARDAPSRVRALIWIPAGLLIAVSYFLYFVAVSKGEATLGGSSLAQTLAYYHTEVWPRISESALSRISVAFMVSASILSASSLRLSYRYRSTLRKVR